MAEGVRLEICRDGWTGGLQLSIGELRRYCDQAEAALAGGGAP